MLVTKRIATLLATSALAATLSGCEALDFLNLDGLINNDAEETTAAPTQTSAAAAGQAPAPFDLSGAQSLGQVQQSFVQQPVMQQPARLPVSSMNIQTSPANAALIGATMGASPSGFGALTPGVPTTTTSTATYTYGAQPNPYAPRTPGIANTAGSAAQSLAYQQALQAGQVSPSPVVTPSIYGTTYTPPTPVTQTVQSPSPVIVRQPMVAPLTTASVAQPATSSALVASSSSSPAQIGTLDPANLSKSTITAIQTALKSRGLYSDVVDGVWGSKSKASMSAYLATRGEPAVTLDTLFSLGVSL